MEIVKNILSILGWGTGAVALFQFFNNRKSNQKKGNSEATQLSDSVLYKRLEFMDERITKLEKLACYDTDCKKRV